MPTRSTISLSVFPLFKKWGALGGIRTCGTRFRNGSSVTGCVYGLTCWFISVIDSRTRSHFAMASRVRRTVDAVSWRTVRSIVTLWSHRIRLIGQLVRPALRHLCLWGHAAGVARRYVLAVSLGFSVLLDV